MSIFVEFQAKARGKEICQTLLLRGHDPLWFKTEAQGDRIVLCVGIMPHWRKALVLTVNDDPNTAEGALNAWKADVLKRWDEGIPPQQVQIAVRRYGERAVRAALTARTAH